MNRRYRIITSSIGVVAAASSFGCSRAGDHVSFDRVGQTSQAIVGGVNDDQSLDANVVVAIESGSGSGPSCSGTLLTPTVVLTARACLASSRSGPLPTVRVGADRPTAASYATVATRLMGGGTADDPPTVNAAQDLALLFLDPKHPVVEGVRIPHQRFPQPNPLSESTDDGAFEYASVTVAGWSPFDADGGMRSTASVRQRLLSGSLRLFNHMWESLPDGGAAPAFWVRDRAAVPGRLSDGDLGSPLFVEMPDHSRQVIGVATRMSASHADVSSCPAGASCDVWADLSANDWSEWILGEIRRPAPSPEWAAMHPRGTEWWRGEVDYTGPCEAAADADCDHVYDWNVNGAPATDGGTAARTRRDNCLGWYTPDQADDDDDGVGNVCDNCADVPNRSQANTSRSRELGLSGDVTPILGRYAEPSEASGAFYPGDACRTWAKTEALQSSAIFTSDPQSSRQLGWRPRQAVQANNVLATTSSVARGGDAWGHTRATFCECREDGCYGPQKRCAARRHFDAAGGTSGPWQAMSVADADAEPTSRSLITLPGGEGLVPMRYGDSTSGASSSPRQNWSWRYWSDVPGLQGARYSTASESVLRGAFALWVKNYGPASSPRPQPGDVTDVRLADDRLSFGDVGIDEKLPAPPLGPLPEIVVMVPADRFGCPTCSPLSRVAIPWRWQWEPRHLSEVGSQGASAFVPSALLEAVKRPDRQLVTPARGEDTLVSSLVIDVRSGRPTGAIVRSRRAATFKPVDWPGTGAPAVADGQRVMAFSASKLELLDFGPPTRGASVDHVRALSLTEMAEHARPLQGERLGTVVAATYRPEEAAYYVLDVQGDDAAAPLRLLRLNTDFYATVVGSWPRSGRWSWYGLDANDDGSLTITSAREDGHAFVVFDVDPEGQPTARLAAEGKGTLAASVQMWKGTLLVSYVDLRTFEPELTTVSMVSLAKGDTINGGRLARADRWNLGSLL